MHIQLAIRVFFASGARVVLYCLAFYFVTVSGHKMPAVVDRWLLAVLLAIYPIVAILATLGLFSEL